MNEKLMCIMLIDDNADDNFFHERIIKKYDSTITVITQESGIDALEYLELHKKESCPDLIFLDINMPRMNGWEFLAEYDKLNEKLQDRVIITMLTTSENPDDRTKAKTWNFVSDYISKPLTKEVLEEIAGSYFGK